ncbi:MAG: hypothetical protein H6672_07155 [Anaerolineaceae bacterium]|nr:hypothetical protein [Anaerolineaceae bacterium]
MEVPRVTPEAKPVSPPETASAPSSDSPQVALERIRQKMEQVATEFSKGKLNRAQFNAIYARYSEQRTIIQRLIERNPQNEAWKQAAAPGHTSFLRDHFEARLQFYLVFQHQVPTPLALGGKHQPDMAKIGSVLHQLWNSKKRPAVGAARKDMGNGQWMVLALGEHAVTLVMYMLEPSLGQIQLVRDLHADFERANQTALTRGTRSLDRFVFPQRALTEKQV